MRRHENAPQIRSAHKDLHDLWQTIHLAQEVGQSLGRRPLLFWPMQARVMSGVDLFSDADTTEPIAFVPMRKAGLARLDKFASRMGQHYARQRNFDFGPYQRSNVSALSPWIRHRLITEEEVLRTTLARHTLPSAEKFVQEVFWRTYFKGWLEQHPSVWTAYQDGVKRALDDDQGAAAYRDAVAGRTGIACFDHWARELVRTGYLHNHARMWFASIWIFTLRLPWELGADFFLRHLIDGDPASNTLSWRWVAGLHTKGKTYLARASNIARYTEGRFNPEGQLSTTAEPLVEHSIHARVVLKPSLPLPKGAFLLLVTPEDCQIEGLMPHAPAGRLALECSSARSPLAIGAVAQAFTDGALQDACGAVPESDLDWTEQIIAAAKAAGVDTVVTGHAPVGPVASQLSKAQLHAAGITLHQVQRGYDTLAWPHAAKGFFALKKKIPSILRELGFAV